MSCLAEPLSPQEFSESDIAIVGMSCRFPGAENIDQFWKNLCNGVESISFFSDSDLDSIDASLIDRPNYVKAGAVLSNIDRFDADFFGYSAKEAEIIDPQQRIFLECAWEALENAGYNPQLHQELVGVYAGSSSSTYLINNVCPSQGFSPQRPFLNHRLFRAASDLHIEQGNNSDHLPMRVSFKLGLTGPSVNVQTTCSTSLVAVHLASQSLYFGECDVALAGGVSIFVPHRFGYLYREGMILSPDGHCRAFDAEARGTVFGNGAGVVVLKLLKKAVADGDSIYAVIKGSAVNNDGAHKMSYTAPSVPGQVAVISEALAVSRVDASTIGYVEAHGTGTALGDPIEVTALSEAFRQSTSEPTDKTGFCAIGSVKTNIGHLDDAAGIAGLIKTVLALKHRLIPPSLNFSQPNPNIDFTKTPFYVNTELAPWNTEGIPPRAGVSSFGMGGTNCHLVLEAAPEIARKSSVADRSLHLLTLSAKTETALQDLARRYADYLDTHREVKLGDICFSANTGRHQFGHRLAMVADSHEQLTSQLQGFLSEPKLHGGNPGKIAFLFTGQGAQYGNMGRQLYQTQPEFRKILDRCADILKDYRDISLLEILYGDRNSELDNTAYTQPALFAIEYALAQVWRAWGIEPDVVMGHSVGEYVAACLAGVFSLEDGLKLIAYRSSLMQALPQDGEMVAVLASESTVRSIVSSYSQQVSIAAINGPQSLVISGARDAIGAICQILDDREIKTKKLKVSHAFHSPLMQPMLAQFDRVAREIRFSPPQIPLVSNVTGESIAEAIATPEYWCDHICEPVRFARSMERLREQDVATFVEIGPKPTLLNMGRRCDPGNSSGLWLSSLDPERGDWQTLLMSLATLYQQGYSVDWQGFDRDFWRQRVHLPTYAFQRRRYWVEASGQPTGRFLATPAPARGQEHGQEHPLLGIPLPLAGTREIRFQGQVSQLSPPWLGDHRVFATTILPGTAYLEMALAAGASRSDRPCRLEGATVQKALEIPESGEALPLQMVLQPEAETAYRFEIFSLDASSQEPGEMQTWNLHATGKIFSEETVKPETVDLPALQQQMAEEIPVDRLYEKFQQQQIDYGPSFHAVERVWRDRDRALGYIVLPEEVAADLEGYQLHPVLLDACLQVLDATLLEEREETYVPVFFQTVSRFGQPSSQMWCDARLHPPQSDRPETLEADLTLFDLQGEPIAQMTGLQLRRVRRQTMLGKTENPETDWLYEVVWREQHRAPLTQDLYPPQPRHWLLFADGSDSIEHLAALLRDRGETCTLVFPGQTYEAIGPNEYRLNPAAVEQFGQLWAALPAIDGIVHAWGWEQPDTLTAKTLENEALLSCGSLLHLVQTALDRRLPLPPVWAIAKGCPGIPEPSVPGLTSSLMWGMAQTIPLEHPDLRVIRVNLDPMVPALDLAQGLLAEVFPLQSAESIEDQIALGRGTRYVARLVRRQTAAASDGEIELPVGDDRPFALKIDQRGTPDRLEIQACDRQPPAPGEVEIRVGAAGLNFIDVLNVLGLYPGEPPLGIECAGEIAAKGAGVTGLEIGDAVMAIASGSFSQYVTVDANLVVPKPANCTVEEAATLPESFLTAYWSLHHLAAIAPGDRVLIHAGSGGVGQAAVQLALQAGAEVYATASPSKWHALEALGVTAVMNSRTLDFAEEIMARTDGQGVDIILNSLTGEGFIAKSVSVLAKNGRFLELAKRDIWSVEEMARVRSDVSYFKIDTTQACREQAPKVQQMLRHLVREVENHQLKPLPKTVFPLQSAIRAFRTMQQAKHIGKIVLAFPTAPSTIVRADGSYLITGGMGGLGLRVARWLVEKGARHLILMGRQGATAAIAPQIEELEGAGASVTCLRADVSDESQMRAVFADLAIAAPPLFGIIHAAGVLEDGVLQQQTWERFARVMAPKVQGAWNLHAFTQNQPLDFFVLFSSSASVLGAPGQANYGAANAFLDALAAYRRSQGRPGLSINWGPWEEVGMTAALQLNDRLREKGEDSIPPEAGLQILEQLLQRSAVQVGVMPIDWSRFFERSGTIPPLFGEVYDPARDGGTQDRGHLDPREFRQSLQRLPVEERKASLKTHLQTQAAKILGTDTAARVPTDKRLVDLGLDSLMAIEFLSLVQSSLGLSLSSALLFERPTIDALVDYVLEEWVEIPDADGVAQKNGKTDELKTGDRSTAIAIQPEGSKLPLFCVAGILGSVFDFYGLARYLNPERPLYGLRSYGLMPGETPLTSMADIASQQIQAIQGIQPQGPYHLAGHSFGGKVAFEMARQLQERGETVSFLAILDISAVLAGRDRALERWDDPQYIIQLAEIYAGSRGEEFKLDLENLQELDTDERLDLLFAQLQEKGQKLTRGELQQIFSVYRSNTSADTAYIPQKINIPITLLRATDIGQFDFLPDAAATECDRTWGWSERSTQPIELHQVPGNHFTMVKEPHVQILARQLNIGLGVDLKD